MAGTSRAGSLLWGFDAVAEEGMDTVPLFVPYGPEASY
jgi:hypothetical protein